MFSSSTLPVAIGFRPDSCERNRSRAEQGTRGSESAGLRRKKRLAPAPLVLALILVGCQAVDLAQDSAAPAAPTNLILFIADGMGPASVTMARDYLRHAENGGSLALDGILTGTVRTHSTTSRVTDSAAAATAYATGVKTYNGAIAVDTLERPLGTLVEAAIQRGMAAGIVTTTSLTHATPAAFSAHVPDRGMEPEIAAQQIVQSIDVLLGGGRRFYASARGTDEGHDGERDLLTEAEALGYHIVMDREALLAANRRPLLGLFAHEHLPYHIDRDTTADPSLAEMTRTAISLLAGSGGGFVLIVEGGRIDHAAHGNDAAAHLFDILAYDEAVGEALHFARGDGRTLVVSTSDHETGGLTLGRRVDGTSHYEWNPDVLSGVAGSHDRLAAHFVSESTSTAAFLRLYGGLDAPTSSEISRFDAAENAASAARSAGRQAARRRNEAQNRFQDAFAETIARRALVGWTSGGHTGVDVNLYAFGPGSDRFVGNFDNSEIGRLAAELMNLDLLSVTRRLREGSS